MANYDIEYDKNVFARNLLRLMDATKTRQSDICSLLGVSKSTVSSWCAAQKMPRMDKIERLAAYFNVMKSDLIEDTVSTFLPGFQQNLAVFLRSVDTSDLESAGINQKRIEDVYDGKRTLTHKELNSIADKLGMSMDDLLLILMGKGIEKKEKPATSEGGGLTVKKRALIEKIKNLDDSDIDVVSATADAIIARREK